MIPFTPLRPKHITSDRGIQYVGTNLHTIVSLPAFQNSRIFVNPKTKAVTITTHDGHSHNEDNVINLNDWVVFTNNGWSVLTDKIVRTRYEIPSITFTVETPKTYPIDPTKRKWSNAST